MVPVRLICGVYSGHVDASGIEGILRWVYG